MSKKVLAADVGFVATGLAVMALQGPGAWVPVELVCVRPPKAGKDRKQTLYKSHLDAQHTAALARGIVDVAGRHNIRHVLAEMPHGGARSGRAMRCMALAAGAFAAIVELDRLVPEWYTPDETRIAATGNRKASKEEVIAAMSKRYPGLYSGNKAADLEHLADALATFEAGRNGNLVRSLEEA